jgi:hypothetical protein
MKPVSQFSQTHNPSNQVYLAQKLQMLQVFLQIEQIKLATQFKVHKLPLEFNHKIACLTTNKFNRLPKTSNKNKR